jgi:GABA(A) receptor-associated protein
MNKIENINKNKIVNNTNTMATILGSYKIKKGFVQRKEESNRIREKYPDRIPIICEKSLRDRSSLPDLDKNKYLVPQDFTVGQFMYVIRKRLKINNSEALYLFANGHIMSCSTTLNVAYHNYKDTDGFLYLKYSKESTFG